MTLIADGFLAGSLLTLLLPVALLIALVVWYVKFIRRIPAAVDGKDAAAGAASPLPGSAATPVPAPNPGAADPPDSSHSSGEV